jgi:hypothetical protein
MHKADNFTAIYEPIVGSLTSHNPIGPQGLLRDSFTLLYKVSCGLYLNMKMEWVDTGEGDTKQQQQDF